MVWTARGGGRRRQAGASATALAMAAALVAAAAAQGPVLGAEHSEAVAQRPVAAGEPCVVAALRDATTLALRCVAGERTVTLAAIVAPRPGPPLRGGEPFGDDSAAAATALLAGRTVRVTGRRVTLAGSDVRLALVERGLARLLPGVASPPLLAAERAARVGQRGLWSHDAWRRHQGQVTAPLDLPPSGLRPERRLGEVAEATARRSREERRQAFDAAVADLAQRTPGAGGGAPARAPARADGEDAEPERR